MSALPSDPSIANHFSSPIPPDSHWSIDAEGLLRLDNRIYVPNSNDLRLWILCYKHDHPLSGHFGQNRTLELAHHNYTWLGIHAFVKDYMSSCTSCAHAKTPRHKPYGLLKQLPIPKCLWNSICMDFIEQLLSSSS